MDIRPIKSEADYEAALAEIDRLLEAEPDTPEGDQLEIWTTLVEAYEEQHYPMPPPDPVEAILYFMESRGLSQHDLATYLGGPRRVEEVLSRKRALTIEMIRRLRSGLGIPAESLIQPYPLDKAA